MSGGNPRDVIIRPVVSEKSYASFDENVYTFVVAPDANKIQIRQAIEEIFGVKVTNVNTINRKGKPLSGFPRGSSSSPNRGPQLRTAHREFRRPEARTS